MSTARATLHDLYRSGALEARYPEVPGLLTDLPDAEFATAGRLLARLDPERVLREHPGVAALSVAITGHGTLAQLVPPLTAELARHGLLALTTVGDFDGYVFDLGSPGSDLYAADPALVLCVLDPMVVFDDLPLPWRPEDVSRAAEARLRVISGLAERYQATGHGTLVLNTLPLPRRFTARLIDHRSRARLSALWHETNAALLRLADRFPSVVVIDLLPLLAEGVPATDPRLSVYARAHLSPELLALYAREVGHLARNLTGRTKKALVLDLDGTLWGGVLGDDGPGGIEIGSGLRGAAFGEFQRVAKQLGAQGVLLAAVSKNDTEPVAAVLRDHPGMVLREDDFVRVVADWGPKPGHLAELADALNLGSDAFVFADDSPYECGLVRHELPGVAVVRLDAEPAGHVDRLLRDGWFDTRELTEEDHARITRYRDELARHDFLAGFDSIEEYLHGLDITVELFPAGEADFARVSQLTLRVNQFNMTARRLQPGDVSDLAAEPDRLVLAVRSGDRFGDNGLVGAVFARRGDRTLHLDNLLLSCRVFSRGIEQAVLASLLRHARAEGVTEVAAAYRPTAKNGKVKDFYPRHGFTPAGEDDGVLGFRHDLAELPAHPGHIKLTERFGEP